MALTKPFDEHPEEYEQWFSDNHFTFESELAAIHRVLPEKGKGIEIGIGSGIFAAPLGITDGIEPSKAMRQKALERGLNVIDGVAENLPFEDKSYDFALMVTTICFVDDIKKSFAEAYRILRGNGTLIIGFVDKESQVGQLYLSIKDENIFYKDATFYSTTEVYRALQGTGFIIMSTYQTVFSLPAQINEIQEAERGCGRGSFVVIQAKKPACHNSVT
jgi:SAM-dependent methyltransferase